MKTRQFRKTLLCLGLLLIPSLGFGQAKLQVATLHPALTDLAQQVGGERVKVLALLKPGGDPHSFSPTPADVKSMKGCAVVLASGKRLEAYLDKVKDNLTTGQVLIEVGKNIPSLQINAKDPAFLCCPEHAAGALDPHWWNSVDNMKRAAGIVAEAFGKADAAGAALYKANATAYAERLTELKKWAKKEISAIPAKRRVLATGHLSLTYFAKEFGFKMIPVQGINNQTKATSAEVAAAIGKIRENAIPAIFPEVGASPKQLEEIVRESGSKKGGALVADGNGTGKLAVFEAAFRHNVETIVAALK